MAGGKLLLVLLIGLITKALGKFADHSATCRFSTWQLKIRSVSNLLHIIFLATIDNKMTV